MAAVICGDVLAAGGGAEGADAKGGGPEEDASAAVFGVAAAAVAAAAAPAAGAALAVGGADDTGGANGAAGAPPAPVQSLRATAREPERGASRPRLQGRQGDVPAVVFQHAPVHYPSPQWGDQRQQHHGGVAGGQLRCVVPVTERLEAADRMGVVVGVSL